MKSAMRPDVLLAFGVATIVAMIIIPLPTFLLDVLLSVNIACALMILLVALFARNALEVSTFPSLLLVTTLFRLGLNISTTRGILSQADAGAVVSGFGSFVLQGDVVVGGVIFLVITLVQFLVVAKGAERVAEVGARFTLDAMPGKQMSIDAALRSGSLTEEEAQSRRDELGRESQMYGNMDGAMKFVKGDAIAGLIITALNIVAGIAIGVLRNGLEAAEAIDVYTILTVGDGLVTQIPALLVTLASGVLVTRVSAKDKKKNLGYSLKDELLKNARVLNIGGILMFVLALVPGLPFFPFVICAAIAFGFGAWARLMRLLKKQAGIPVTEIGVSVPNIEAFKQKLDQKVEQAKKQKSVSDQLAPSVVPITIDLDPMLSDRLGFLDEHHDDSADLITTYIPQLRDALYLETGVRFPGVRVRPHQKTLPENAFVIRVFDVPALKEALPADKCLAIAPPEKLTKLGIEAQSIAHPVSKAKISLVDDEEVPVVEAAGITVWKGAGIVALYTASILREKIKDFIGVQEVAEMVERLDKAYPALVKEVVPKVATIPQLVGVLRRLVEEGVSIRNMKAIVEALGEYGERDGDAVFLTEKARAALGAQLAYEVCGMDKHLPALLLDPMIEETIASSIVTNANGQILSIDPAIAHEFVVTIARALQPVVAQGKRPVILTQAEVRRFVRKVIEFDLPNVQVLSFDEMPVDLTIQPVGRAMLEAEAAA